jgi:hypothetical protein
MVWQQVSRSTTESVLGRIGADFEARPNDRHGGATVSMVKFPGTPELQSNGSRRLARLGTTALFGSPRHASSRIGTALDVARTLLVLVFIGTGIVMLRFLLVLAQGVIGH